MRKKAARIIGYVLCALMLIICILMIVLSAAFKSSDIVNIFGVNIYLVQTDDIQTAPKDSAVIVRKCELSDVIKGKLLLYTKGEEKKPTLGYAKDYYAKDGVYFIDILENGKDYTLAESDLVGMANYSSVALGSIINFVKSPFGIFCIAVLPCIVLILYDIIRAFAAKMPPPEVIPQVKNMPEDEVVSPVKISVSRDGKGTYSRNNSGESKAADDVLFSYAARQKKSQRNQRPIIPLTDKKETEPTVKPISEIDINKIKTTAKTPEKIAAGRYAQMSAVESNEKSDENTAKTEEISLFVKENDKDAFFSQSKAPQINRLIPKQEKPVEEIQEEKLPQRTSTKRSTQIIANKSVEDLMKDEDDRRDKSRYDVDEIISGLNKKV